MADINENIIYKVENGVITNASVVDPLSPLEEGFIKSKWLLGIGYVYNKSLNDYYPEGTTKQLYDSKVAELDKYIEDNTAQYTAMVGVLNELISSPDATDEEKQFNTDRKDKAERYLEYLKTAKSTIENAFYQRIKSYEEI